MVFFLFIVFFFVVNFCGEERSTDFYLIKLKINQKNIIAAKKPKDDKDDKDGKDGKDGKSTPTKTTKKSASARARAGFVYLIPVVAVALWFLL